MKSHDETHAVEFIWDVVIWELPTHIECNLLTTLVGHIIASLFCICYYLKFHAWFNAVHQFPPSYVPCCPIFYISFSLPLISLGYFKIIWLWSSITLSTLLALFTCMPKCVVLLCCLHIQNIYEVVHIKLIFLGLNYYVHS